MISSRFAGVAKSCSIEPRSYSRATVSAVSITATMARMKVISPGRMKMALRRPGLKRERARSSIGWTGGEGASARASAVA